ncbi:hypothetical protein V8C26DRAFT_429998 [Trichoderma gracile]
MASPNEALVIMTAIDPPEWFAYPVRRLLLDSSKSVASIGRMSSRNGDYTAKESNGWMESAVMSRHHATLLFDPQAQRVFIKDVGSLHGTFYNDTRLQKHQSQALKDGDVLQFGIAIARGSDTCPPCKMRVGVEYRPCSSVQRALQGPTVFRVPDDSDDESEEEYIEDENIRWSTKILRDNGIHPARNCILRKPIITIDESDHEMDSPAPETEEQTASARSVQDHMTDKTGSDHSPSRLHTPRETIDIPDDISDDDPMFYEDEYDGDEVTDYDDDHSSLGDPSPHGPLGGSFLDKSHDGSRPDATEIHEAEVYDRFENDCLPPIINMSPANDASAPNQPRPSVHLPSLFDSFRSQEVSTSQDDAPSDPVAEKESANESAAPLERDWPNWPKDVAESRATESSRLLDSGAKFLETPLKEQGAEPVVEPSLELDETSAYQFQVTKTYYQQQQSPYQQQHDESSSADSTGDQPSESQERAAPNKRKAEEISEVTVEEIAFAQPSPIEGSALPSLRPRALDVEMDVSSTGAHSAVEGPQAKRLRKAAEIFGYAALGGVAVMSALIATAPTL